MTDPARNDSGAGIPPPRRRYLRHFRIGAAIAAALFLLATLVPAFPYYPTCDWNFFARTETRVERPYYYFGPHVEVVGPLSEAYLDLFTETPYSYLRFPYRRTGNTLWLSWWHWRGGGDLVFILNAGTLNRLADPQRSPVWQDMPEDVRALLRDRLRGMFSNPVADCEVVRALSMKGWGR